MGQIGNTLFNYPTFTCEEFLLVCSFFLLLFRNFIWSHYTSGAIRRSFYAGFPWRPNYWHSYTLYHRIGRPSTVSGFSMGLTSYPTLFRTSHGFVQSILTSETIFVLLG